MIIIAAFALNIAQPGPIFGLPQTNDVEEFKDSGSPESEPAVFVPVTETKKAWLSFPSRR